MQSHLERARGEKFKGRDGTLGEGRDESAGGWGECGGVGKGGKGKGGGGGWDIENFSSHFQFNVFAACTLF